VNLELHKIAIRKLEWGPRTGARDHVLTVNKEELVSLLLMKGLHRIALLGGSMLYTVNQSRLEGYKQAHDRACCKIDESLLFLELETDDLRMQAVSQALERKPDCILCMDDRLTLLAMNMLKQQGVRVPQDIRVASLYDSSALAESSPAITAVQFDAYALGRKATQQLLQTLKGREVETRVELGYQVSMRESTKT